MSFLKASNCFTKVYNRPLCPLLTLFLLGSSQYPLSEPLTAEIAEGEQDLRGKIAIIPSYLLASNLQLVRDAQSRGAVGVLSTLDFLCKLSELLRKCQL
jgi:hypothetical protein